MLSRLDVTWEEFVKTVKEHKEGLILFGASSCADIFLNKLKETFDVKYIIDNDINKQGKHIFGYNVYGIEKLSEAKSDDILLITSTYHEEIKVQLESFGFRGIVYSYLHLRNKVMNQHLRGGCLGLKEKIIQLKKICSDEKSKELIDKIMSKRQKGILDYSDIYEGNQYFVDGIIQLDRDEVFIDGGAFDGETVREFIHVASNQFKKIYSFEMDKVNFDAIQQEAFDDRVEFLNYGLWDTHQVVSFIENERGSEIIEDGSSSAECVALDEVVKERVTFIKMDIEGAEQKALIGAKQIILRDKPQLAICLYHKFEDLWEIPCYVHQLVPEYKIFIRHHGKNNEETVMYAHI